MQDVLHNIISAFGKLKLSHPITTTTITADKYNRVMGKVGVAQVQLSILYMSISGNVQWED